MEVNQVYYLGVFGLHSSFRPNVDDFHVVVSKRGCRLNNCAVLGLE